jgi:peptidoglycan LD-endopeptidase LytH
VVPLAAVLLAAAAVTGCSTATRPAARSATATTLAAPTTTTSATPASGPPTRSLRPLDPRVLGAPGTSSRFGAVVVSYGHSHSYNPATDIFTDRGCAFVAVTDGVVDEVNRVDRWDPTSDRGADRGGLSVSLIGIDGVRYYGSHLQSIAPGIAHGAHLRAGQLLGRIDNSGDARTTPTGYELPRRNLDAGLTRGRLRRSGMIRISSYFRSL